MQTRRSILICEVDPIMCGILRDVLQDEYEVRAACDGREAAEALLQERFDLWIIDLDQRSMDRVDWIEVLRSARGVRDTPILVISAFPELAQRLAPRPAQAILTKPFWIDELVRVVAATLRPAGD